MDDVKLQNFIGKYVGDLGGAFMMAMVLIGDELGLYKAMADGQSVSADALGEVMAEAGFSQFPAGDRDSFQPHPRGAQVTEAPHHVGEGEAGRGW